MERPAFDAEVNVVGTVNALEAARAAGAHLVFASTGGAIYGDVDEPAREDSPLLPVSAYGLAKLSAEVYLDGWNRVFGSAARRAALRQRLRAAPVGGPRGRGDRDLPRAARRGRPTAIFGDGTITRDFVHVDDVVRALLLAAGHRGGVFNVGTGIETSISELHAVCQRAVGVEAPPDLEPPRAGDAQRSVLDPSRATRDLGFTASVTLADGIAATLASGD